MQPTTASRSASAASASVTSSTLTATHPYLHPKLRVGMTNTTKLHYNSTEQRFTSDDMQPQAVLTLTEAHSRETALRSQPLNTAHTSNLSCVLSLLSFSSLSYQRAARVEVQAMFTTGPLSAHPPWNNSTLPLPTALEQSTHFDNKHYATLQSQHLIHLARTRLTAIRQHADPDADPLAIQPRWNVSAKLEDDEGHTVDMDVLRGMGGKREVELSGYVGLVEAEVRWEEEKRRERRERGEVVRREEQRRRVAAEWERKEQWQADTAPIATLPTDTYKTSNNSNSQSTTTPLTPATSTTTLAHYLQTTPPLQPATTATPTTATLRVEPVAVYCHPGHYAWVSPSLRQWSCCHSAVHSIRGCVRVGDAADRVRLVRAGSEDGRGRVVRLLHGGVWDANREGGMWSCCGSGVHNGRGCQTKTLVREDRWNLE